jgi:hypothetical protein
MYTEAKPLSRAPFSSLASVAALAVAGVCLTASPLSAATDGDMTGPTASQEQTSAAGDRVAQASATTSKQAQSSGQRPIAQLPDRYKVSTWIGRSVENADGEELGTVEEMIMDDFGRVRYVVIKSDQLASEKEGELVAVPTGLFEPLKADQTHLVLDVPSSHMSGAPSFSSSEYPNMGQESVSTLIVTYWVPEDAAAQDASGQVSGDRAHAETRSGQAAGMASNDRGADRQGQARVGSSAMEQQFGNQADDGSGLHEPNRDMVYLPQDKAQMFDKLDEDGDGVIGRNEAEANERLSRQFDQINSYANQGISRSEFAAFEVKDAGESQKDSSPRSQDRRDQQRDSQMDVSPQSKPMGQ